MSIRQKRFLLPLLMATLCLGSFSAPARGEETLGIYFDEDFTLNQIDVPDTPATVTGYLVLHDPLEPYPVYGWECCVAADGPATFLGWELEGQTINVLDPPCFMVGIGGDPLPSTDGVLLATFQMLVDLTMPVTFSVGPVHSPSIPGEMAYLSGAAGDEIRPMSSATGSPDVAFINAEVPWPVLSEEFLYFDEHPLGTTTVKTLTVTNTGGGLLHLDIAAPADTANFFLPGVSGEVWLGHMEHVSIPVAFTPTVVGLIESSLPLGSMVDPVPLRGLGREPVITWEISGNLAFQEIAAGTDTIGVISLINTGEVPIPVEPALNPGCEGFTLLTWTSFVLQPGSTVPLQVLFAPPTPGTYACELDLGAVIPPVPATGSAREPILFFTVEPDSIDFGNVGVGSDLFRNFLVRNRGEADIELYVIMDDSTGCFSVYQGATHDILEPGDSQMVTIRFSPVSIGLFEARVTLGEVIPPVPLVGRGEETGPLCVVYPDNLNFGTVPLGTSQSRNFSVTNTGNTALVIQPQISGSEYFSISSTVHTVYPGEERFFTVWFTPLSTGFLECQVALGCPECPSVHCTGTGNPDLPPPGDQDLIGIFFDNGYEQFYTDIFEPGVVEAYLVMKNISNTVGVQGWECRHEIEGPAILVQFTPMGQAVSVGIAPDYIVGLAEPLPPTPDVLLATFQYFVTDAFAEIYLLLSPVSTPSIPGQMAFLPGDDPQQVLPMYPYTGFFQVAFINTDALAVDRPTKPVIHANGSKVELAWDLPQGEWDGFHVYRRDDGGDETRLTTAPGAIDGPRVTFTDQPAGFPSGTVLFYSYSLLKNGVEGPRSPEAEFELGNTPVSLTRLLPNIPNPFNPRTRIRFELAAAGPVRVAIYDISGRLVRTLESGTMAIGSHESVWQGRDDRGRQVPSGAYYVRLETPSGIDHRKIMLLK